MPQLRPLLKWVKVIAFRAALALSAPLIGWIAWDIDAFELRTRLTGWSAEGPAGLSVSELALDSCIEEAMRDQDTLQMTEIKRLTCADAGIRELAPIAHLTALEELYLPGNALDSLATLGAHPKLRTLSVAGNRNLVALDGIERIPALERLYANKTALQSLKGLEALSALTIVQATDSHLRDISALSGHRELIEVRLNHNRQLQDISALADKPSLQWLTLYQTAVERLDPILANRAMTTFGVSGTDRIPCSSLTELRRNLSPDARIYWPEQCAG